MLIRGALGRGQIITIAVILVVLLIFITRPPVPSLESLRFARPKFSDSTSHETVKGERPDPEKVLEGITAEKPEDLNTVQPDIHPTTTQVHAVSTLAAHHDTTTSDVAAVTIASDLSKPSTHAKPASSHSKPVDSNSWQGIPRKIWQTWKERSTRLDDEFLTKTRSWQDKNPQYRYELLTDNTTITYIEDTFASRPDIVDTFKRIKDIILVADLLRYLVLLAEGGLYVDMDTECTRPIDDWLPEQYRNTSGFVVGIEYDATLGGAWADFDVDVQLCQWAIAAKPNNPVTKHIVKRVLESLNAFAPDGGPIHVTKLEDVLKVTGPRVFSHAILESLTEQLGRPVGEDDIKGLTEPKQIGDVLVLPINAFGSGQGHSQSKDWGNEEQLLAHSFHGWVGWKSTFGDG